MNNQKPKYKRILLKLSGEAMQGNKPYGIDPHFILFLAQEIKQAHDAGVQMGIVTGGGNIFRGLNASREGMNRSTADYMGMLATIFNSMALQDALEHIGLQTRLQTAIEMRQIAEPFLRRKAIHHLEKGRIVILGGGTGLPFITTDTTAAMRGLELGAEAIFKATKVDGVYEEDPKKNPQAKKLDYVSFDEAFQNEKISVIDKAAISLCRANKVHIVVFSIYQKGNLKKAIMGEPVGSTIC